jgi:glyoxylase-like metal-dependent hydrolase (beta-lactamase superfamily II)
MATNRILTLDLNFQGRAHAIAVYLIRHAAGVVLIDSGPGSTLSALEAGLAKEGLAPGDVTHLLLTHIYLDQAGSDCW